MIARSIEALGLRLSESGLRPASGVSLLFALALWPATIGAVPCWSGSVAGTVLWRAVDSPVQVCGNLLLEPGATLRIEAGTVVRLAADANLTIADGAVLLAVGTETNHIRFISALSGANWGQIAINGSTNSPETQICWADFQGNGHTAIHSFGGTVFLDHLSFESTAHAYVSLDDSSFVVSNCYFPRGEASFEPAHGTGGIKPGGHGIFARNFFGGAVGYNDLADFTGGKRPGPIVHFINNVFLNSDDDGLDLDGTDAWIEGNIFAHVHRNGAPDSSAAISGGDSGSDTSRLTIVGNLFFDCDNAVTAKEGNSFALFNNTIVRTTRSGGTDFASGVFNLRDTTPTLTRYGRGIYAQDNIVWDAETLVRNYDPLQSLVTLNGNILPLPWEGPGASNRVVDPLLNRIPELSETSFTNWSSAQILRSWFSLETNSPARGTGFDGMDKGGVIPLGIFARPLPENSLSLHLGFHGDIDAGWPLGAGYLSYRWRADSGDWSVETPISAPLDLSNLSPGVHRVELAGRRDSGLYQDDPVFGADAVSTSVIVAVPEPGAALSIQLEQTKVNLTFNAEAGITYAIEFKDHLSDADWTQLESRRENQAGPVRVQDDRASGSRFYRLIQEP